MLILCPACKKKTAYDASNPYRPFCASSCKDQDFIAWAEEAFTISTDLTEDDLDQLETQLADISQQNHESRH